MDFKAISGFQVTAMRQQFAEQGTIAGREAGRKVGKLALDKLNFEELKIEVRKVAIASAEKYAVKAREFVKMAVRISEEAGGKSGAALGKQLGIENGEDVGGDVGEKVGRDAGEKAARELAGKTNVKVVASTQLFLVSSFLTKKVRMECSLEQSEKLTTFMKVMF